MVRKFAAALVASVIASGAVFAEEVKGTFVKFADGKLTLKVGDAQKEYKVPPGLTVKRKSKDGKEVEIVVAEVLSKIPVGTHMIVSVEKDEVKTARPGR